MEKATGNGTREVKLSSAQVSEQARALLDKEGLEAVLAFAGRCIANGGDVKLGQARVLLGLASKIQLADPSRALGLLERVFELTPNLMEARAMACSLYDRSGQAKKGRDCALHLIDAPESTPAQVLVACDYLVRFPPDSNKALDAAKKAFDQLGKPLKWASLVLEIALKTADWPMASELTRQLEEAYARGEDAQADEKPRTNLLWCANEAYNLQVIKNWSKKQLTLPQDTLGDIDIEPLGNGRRLRVGYLSSDYREHPTSRLINGLFRHHDRSKVELFMYCSGWDDKSAMRKEVESHFEHVHSVQGLTDRAAAQLMRQHRIDVLVELNGPTRAHRMGILGYRPAPVQIDYLGWPGSVGGRVVDYVVGDAYTVPEGAEKAYPEKVIRIDATYQVNDYAAQEPLPACTRQSQGLPEGVPVLGMFNAVNKVRAEVWEVWMRIMRAVPDAILWMLDPGKHGRDNIARITKAHGVAPKRIYIGHPNKQREHLARMQCADLMLDPWPYGGHTTTADALFAGVPVVALQGTNFAGRVSGGLLKAAGLEALVQPDVDAYVKTAVMLLRNPQELQRMRAFIRERVPKSNVFDAKGKARQFEAAYRIALERAIERKSPIHINIQPASAESGKKVPPALVSQAIPTPVFDTKVTSTPSHKLLKVAVVTPYWRSDPKKLSKCCDSVRQQTYPCDHILVADGAPQDLPKESRLIHMVLPANVGNCGATPRGFGAQYAFVQGYDAVAFLDSDNWYEPDHIEECVRLMTDKNLDLVFARRHIIFPDGDILKVDDPQDESHRHVDTNCYFVSKSCAYLMSVWAMWPKEFGVGEDRIMKKVIDQKNPAVGWLTKKTVWYESNWPWHYSLAQKKPVQRLRSSEKSIHKGFDEERFFQNTGFLFPSKQPIPKKIHIVWIGDESKTPITCIQSWKDMHPEWEVKVWGNKEYKETDWINKKHMNAMYPVSLAGVADMMRYEILLKEGGITVDADSFALRPLSEDFLSNKVFAAWENEIQRPGLIANGTMGSEPENDFIRKIVESIREDTNIVTKHPWKTTGPTRLTMTFRNLQYFDLKIYPSHYFTPRHHTGLSYKGNQPVYADQLWTNTGELKNRKVEDLPSELI